MNDLLTERLAVRPLTAAEAAQITTADQGAGEGWAADYPAPGERIGARKFLEACAAVGDPYPFGNFEIRLRETGVAIGGIGFHSAPDADGAVTVGYGLAESARGRGYAREALAAVIAHARTHGATAVLADTDLGNLASQRVLLANGLEPIGEDARLKYFRLALPGG